MTSIVWYHHDFSHAQAQAVLFMVIFETIGANINIVKNTDNMVMVSWL